MPVWPQFCGPSYVSMAPQALNERLMNLYVQPIELPGGKNRYALYGTPGTSLLAQASESPGRGAFAQSDRCFIPIGQTFYELTSAFALTSRGTMLVNANPATICTNGSGGSQVFITSGERGDIFDLISGVYTAGVVATGCTQGGMINGRFLRFDVTNSKIACSNSNDGLTWDPTLFAQRSAASDPWKAMLVRPPLIWLVGEQTGDVWYDAGAFPFPYAPIANVQYRHGIAATFSIADAQNGPIWLSKNAQGQGLIVQAQGYTPVPVSTEYVNSQIASYSKISDAIAYTYQELGREFYQINFPTAGATWVWDTALGALGWHERGHWDAVNVRYQTWSPQFHCMAFNKHIVADARTGVVAEQALSIYQEADGSLIRRQRIAPGLPTANHDRVRYSVLELLMQTGVGLVSGQGSDPTITMARSRDAGQSWGMERRRSIGAKGQTRARVMWFRCGSAYDGAFRFTMSDPVPYRFVNAFFRTPEEALRAAA